MTTKFRTILGLIAILCTLSAGQARAQEGIEDKIRALAAAVHRFNVGSSSYTSWVGGNLGKQESYRLKHLQAGDPMPAFTLRRLTTTTQLVQRSELKAPYLLNVWASWCPPCRAEFPLLTRTATSADTPFSIYFVNTDDTQRLASSFLRTQRAGIEVLFDAPPQYAFNELVGIVAIPDSILVARDGTVAAIQVGEITEPVLDFLRIVAANPGVGSFAQEGAIQPVEPFTLDKTLPLITGQNYFGWLNDRVPYVVYHLTGAADATYNVVMRAMGHSETDALDPYLVLLDSRGDVVAFDDDSGAYESAVKDRYGNDLAGSEVDAIMGVTLPETGDYYLVIGRAGYEVGQNEGSYQFLVIDDSAFF